MAVVDFDDFKQINDMYGHVVGDKVICQIDQTFMNVFQEGDIAARNEPLEYKGVRCLFKKTVMDFEQRSLWKRKYALKIENHAFIAHRNLAERARGLILHSSTDGLIGSGAISR